MSDRRMVQSDRQRFGRRTRFSLAVLAAQVLLIATAIAWSVHMALIAMHGEVYFVEPNSAILLAELIGTALIVVYAATVFTLQWKRMGERRRTDRADSSPSPRVERRG